MFVCQKKGKYFQSNLFHVYTHGMVWDRLRDQCCHRSNKCPMAHRIPLQQSVIFSKNYHTSLTTLMTPTFGKLYCNILPKNCNKMFWNGNHDTQLEKSPKNHPKYHPHPTLVIYPTPLIKESFASILVGEVIPRCNEFQP